MATAHVLPAPAGLFAERYRVQCPLGSGGESEVVRALDERLQRPVALKVLRPSAGGEVANRFTREARTLARLRHPGLVAVHDCGTWDGLPYLALELVEGPTLRQVLAREPLSPLAVAQLGAQLARILSFVHEHGVVHRDVKPSNILFDAGGTARLVDFGIARPSGDPTTTRAGLVTGTPAYLAPEQIRGRRALPASDVYALGLVLLECLTGRREYHGTPSEAAAARLSRPPRIPAWLPVPLAGALHRMTLTDPPRRPPAPEVADLLAELTSRTAPTRPRRHRRPALRLHHRHGAALAAAAAFLSLTGLTSGSTAPPQLTGRPNTCPSRSASADQRAHCPAGARFAPAPAAGPVHPHPTGTLDSGAGQAT
ncbi:serine/threonine-protein kinase [Kitasatospora sp. NPDC051853]|uniref:serine/threonine-protein kinase n=1 Tax=Kitasatospora sp. NPDC051853 TaxID=3364058 RepID=UPI0037A8742D